MVNVSILVGSNEPFSGRLLLIRGGRSMLLSVLDTGNYVGVLLLLYAVFSVNKPVSFIS